MAIKILAFSVLAPAAIAVAAAWLSRRVLRSDTADRYAAAIGFAAAFCAGFWLLPVWAFEPPRLSHWLPHLAAAASLAGPIGLAQGLNRAERWGLYLMFALFAAWLVVPTWSDLQPARPVCVPLLAVYLTLIAALLDPLPDRVRAPLFLALLAGTAAALAVLLLAFWSQKYAQVALIAAAATIGCSIAGLIAKKSRGAQGLVFAWTIVVGLLTFVVCIEPSPPLVPLLIVPAAPLSLWAFRWRPLARLEGLKAAAAQTVAVLVPVGIASIWLLLTR